jgi:hypothetical protein
MKFRLTLLLLFVCVTYRCNYKFGNDKFYHCMTAKNSRGNVRGIT